MRMDRARRTEPAFRLCGQCRKQAVLQSEWPIAYDRRGQIQVVYSMLRREVKHWCDMDDPIL
jgi:cytochrome c-type biogenesis protein CcmH/NrfF